MGVESPGLHGVGFTYRGNSGRTSNPSPSLVDFDMGFAVDWSWVVGCPLDEVWCLMGTTLHCTQPRQIR